MTIQACAFCTPVTRPHLGSATVLGAPLRRAAADRSSSLPASSSDRPAVFGSRPRPWRRHRSSARSD